MNKETWERVSISKSLHMNSTFEYKQRSQVRHMKLIRCNRHFQRNPKFEVFYFSNTLSLERQCPKLICLYWCQLATKRKFSVAKRQIVVAKTFLPILGFWYAQNISVLQPNNGDNITQPYSTLVRIRVLMETVLRATIEKIWWRISNVELALTTTVVEVDKHQIWIHIYLNNAGRI